MNILIKLTCLIGLVVAPILGGHGGDDHASNQDVSKTATASTTAVTANTNGAAKTTFNANNGVLAANYKLIPTTSEIIWRGSKIVGDDHDGTIAFAGGNLDVAKGGLITGGQFIVDMTTLEANMPGDENGQKNLTGHLKNDDFFDVGKFPTAILKIKNGKMSGGTMAGVADLTIKDKTESVNFEGNYSNVKGVFQVTSRFTFDRTKFGVVYKSGNFVKDLGDKAIKDDILLEIVANLQPSK